VIWDLNNFILEKEERLNQSEFYKLNVGHTRQMVVSSNLSLIPYPLDNLQIRPYQRQDLLPGRQQDHLAQHRNDLTRPPYFYRRFIHTDSQYSTYRADRFMISSKVDNLGSQVDIYI
jgi:hypothetical protein